MKRSAFPTRSASASALSALAALLLLASFLPVHNVLAGPNEDGVLILHYAGVPNPTCDNIPYCNKLVFPGCDQALIRTDEDVPCAAGLWVFASFPETSTPRVASIAFGAEMVGIGDLILIRRDTCADDEVAGDNWPRENTGTVVSWDTPREDLLFEVYVFFPYAYNYYGGDVGPYTVNLTPHPTLGGVFTDDSTPPVADPIVDYGSFGFLTDGYLPVCPAAGACCFTDGSCERLRPTKCASLSGEYSGDETLCDPNPCEEGGACCFPDGTCTYLTASACIDVFGAPLGPGTVCEPNACPQPLGACCLPSLVCEVRTPPDCDADAGNFFGADTSCEPGICGGACCSGLACVVSLQADCDLSGGTYLGDSILCSPNPCQSGACCLGEANCTISSLADCELADGTYLGADTSCAPESCAPVPEADTYFIRPDGLGDFPTIQQAIAHEGAGDKTAIELGDGVFTGPGNHNLDFLGKALRMRSRSDDPLACIIDCSGPESVERGLVLRSGEGMGTSVTAITFRNGNAGDGRYGGAVLVETSTPGVHARFIDCRFEDNEAVHGGAIYSDLSDVLVLIDCVLERNSSTYGGAIESRSLDTRLTRCEFRLNQAVLGGAISVDGGSLYAADCVLESNASESEGGAVMLGTSMDSSEFLRCDFLTNESSKGGGVSTRLDPSFTYCSFVENSSVTEGGAVYVRSGAPSFGSCTFYRNGSAFGGSIAISYEGTVTIDRCIIAFGLEGMAVAGWAGNSAVASCTDVYNNVGGDWTALLSGQHGTEGNFQLDPEFCLFGDEPLSLYHTSPCLSGNHPDGAFCGQIGAFGEGCSTSEAETPDQAELPTHLQLRLLTPNPVRNELAFSVELPEPSRVSLSLVDVAGRIALRLDDRELGAGVHQIRVDSAELANLRVGVYLVRLIADREMRTIKFVRTR